MNSEDDEDEWHEKILSFINKLKESGKLSDYNQLAFLFSSVKHQRVTELANFLEKNGINVYSPRSDMFFKRDEIKLTLGCLMLMFPKYVKGLENQEYKFLQVEHYSYYRDWNYDGVVMQPTVTDVPDKKGIVSGVYGIPENAGTIRVKITDLLSESLEVEVE